MRMPWSGDEEVHSPLIDGALLVLRVGAGGLLAGHGAQKLLGWFGGHGLRGTGQWMESMGLKPGKAWALAASGGELGGGMLTALGLGGPLGPIGVISAMTMATAKAHWGKPIWVSSGGAELPVAYMTIAGALAMAGPGRYSLDHYLGIKMHWAIPAAATALAAATVAYGALVKAPAAPPTQEEPKPADAEQDEPVHIGERSHARAA